MTVRAGPAARAPGEAVLARRAAVRLGAQAAALVALIVVVLTAVAVVVVIGAQRAQVTAVLDSAIGRADDVDDPPSGVHLLIRDTAGRVTQTPGLPPGVADDLALAAAAVGGRPPAVERNVRDVQYEIATARRDDGVTVQAILDLTANHAERNRLLRMMLATGVVGLVVAGAAGTWLGHRALAPLSAALSLQHRFVADAGHELRTPLTLLGTRAQMLHRHLRRDGADPQLLGEAAGVVADSRRLTAILEDLLLAADPLGERPTELVDLAELARDISGSVGADASVHDVTVRTEAPDPVPVVGSRAALTRALTALVDNAVRHAHSAVVVEARPADGHAVLEVTDDGDGVDPAVAPRLFERFATGARPTGPGRRRYGLGLALVAEIAAAHHGAVELVADGPGTRFRLVLPAVPARADTTPKNL
ncbi:HAMP domain-containing histidine kinase [Pseudonocardia kujensis]|uniref:sensor histidine kinase n=1 Tax=Pseudonocardia kujensis TaxID=1128675 RepID=UPI001E4217F4|nr:HAMP domain-containing sensor histidine kinase [Pseudonocardia kujensis]MCE0768223.1 HAMP domain-containing histidine kinase [Pseudonocardia kujensis]